ncbi:hypothetical protein SAMN05428961_10898 [Paenibacillus sp. OK060]|nr:hypothetical protein SAMN05428961_10898 [Paenibacillus sp. OK060]SLK14833.1 hypothetical protein SAMN06272722_109112 [Paenibacillus sp. RU5A]SOC73689.1 hypothetical protein SAMN05880581_109112 [Paenibacillus sp. RU26A]SOC75864.1 hypothetical protein SAMN05880586_109112 [Paenibacillus sp. RU5M]
MEAVSWPNNALFIYMHFDLYLNDGKPLFGLMQNAPCA